MTAIKFLQLACLLFVLTAGALLASSMVALPEEPSNIELNFDSDVCLRIDVSASAITDVRTFSRLGMKATWFEIELPSASEDLSVDFASASEIVGSRKGGYFGQCDFTEFEAGFLRQVRASSGICRVGGHTTETFHSSPGSNQNVIVDCSPELPGICTSMTLWHRIDSVELRIEAVMREPNPQNWLPVSEELRQFIDGNVSALPDC